MINTLVKASKVMVELALSVWALMAYLLVLRQAVVQRSIAHPDKPGCQSPEGVSIAEEALEWVHRDRKQGYILSFNRLYDVKPSTDPHLVSRRLDIIHPVEAEADPLSLLFFV
ncbi:unnamed protein product [Boreogadus saida]